MDGAHIALHLLCLQSYLVFDLPLHLHLLSLLPLLIIKLPVNILLTELNIPQLLPCNFIGILQLVLENSFLNASTTLLSLCIQLRTHPVVTLAKLGSKRFTVLL